MKIASWNVNSINVRLPQVSDWLQATKVDVLALQEIKVIDDLFPTDEFTKLGYHMAISGQKTYNGVALIASSPITNIVRSNPYFPDEEKRFLAATINDIRIVNLYVPNGQSIDSEKYKYKLAYLNGVKQYLKSELENYSYVLVLGDFNIAPSDIDVHDPLLWQDSVLVSPEEREIFAQILNLGFVDSLRFQEPEASIYTWWDYRQGAFRRNHGLRIDHILFSKSLKSFFKNVVVDKEPRKASRPSDHAPLWIELDHS